MEQIAEFMGWASTPNSGAQLGLNITADGRAETWLYTHELKYHTSWDWQVPVWAKLALEVKTWLAKEYNEVQRSFYLRTVERYEEAIFQNNPKKGHEIITSLLNWYKENKKP